MIKLYEIDDLRISNNFGFEIIMEKSFLISIIILTILIIISLITWTIGAKIKNIFEKYKKSYKRIIVGTTENLIPFYVLNGFTKYHHTVKNFFLDNYKEEI